MEEEWNINKFNVLIYTSACTRTTALVSGHSFRPTVDYVFMHAFVCFSKTGLLQVCEGHVHVHTVRGGVI